MKIIRKKITIALLNLLILIEFIVLPILCYCQTTIIEMPVKISKKDKQRARILLGNIYDDLYDNITDENMRYDYNPSSVENNYRGFFMKAKLLRNEKPVNLFVYMSDGQCNACHKAGISLIDDYDQIIDMIDIFNVYGSINAELVEYDNKGTCVILMKHDDESGGGIGSVARIIRLNSNKEFTLIYSKMPGLSDCYQNR